MREQTLRDRICDEFSKLPPWQLEHISRMELLESSRLAATRRIDIEAYKGPHPHERDCGNPHAPSVDFAQGKLPPVGLDISSWRNLILESARFSQCMLDFFQPALTDRTSFPVTFQRFESHQFAPPNLLPTRVAMDVSMIPDRELRALLLQRELRQQSNQLEIHRLFPELKEEIRRAFPVLKSELKLPHLELPLQQIDKRLEKLSIEIFDPLQSQTFTDVAFYSIFSHTIFVSADLNVKEYRPILRHEMLHAVSGLAPIVARHDALAEKAEQLPSSSKDIFFWDRYGLVAFRGKDTNFVWLNEGVTEFLNQTIGRSAGHPDCTVEGWGRLADIIGRMAKRVDISPLLSIYFSDAPIYDPVFNGYRRQLQANVERVYGRDFLSTMENVWMTERSQFALCTLYNERFNSRGLSERIRGFYGSIVNALSRYAGEGDDL